MAGLPGAPASTSVSGPASPPPWVPPTNPPIGQPAGAPMPPPGPPSFPPPQGGPPLGGPPPCGGEAPRRRTGLIVTLVVVVLAVVGCGTALWALVLRDQGSSYPSAWDPRVAELAAKVEDLRELQFDHPVYVDFLPDDEFKATVTTDESQQTDEQRAQADLFLGQMRALGLVQGDVDLAEQANTLTGEGVLAVYDPATKRVRVKGTELDQQAKATVVHELTHALQDQHFDLQAAQRLDEERDTSTARTVIEGDAMDVERAYVDQLSAADHEAYDRQSEQSGSQASDKVKDVPDVLQAFFAAPYALGPSFVDLLVAQGGHASVNSALGNPPASEAQVFDPVDYLGGRAPVDVDTPTTTDGQERLEDGTFGALAWYLVLSERIDPLDALTVVDNWAGDSYVSYREDGRVCMKVRVKGQSDAAIAVIGGHLDQWAAAMPAGAAKVARDGDTLELTSCDPGAGVDLGIKGHSSSALGYPSARLQIAADILSEGKSQGISADTAACVADKVVREVTLDELKSDELPPARQRELQALAARSMVSCR